MGDSRRGAPRSDSRLRLAAALEQRGPGVQYAHAAAQGHRPDCPRPHAPRDQARRALRGAHAPAGAALGADSRVARPPAHSVPAPSSLDRPGDQQVRTTPGLSLRPALAQRQDSSPAGPSDPSFSLEVSRSRVLRRPRAGEGQRPAQSQSPSSPAAAGCLRFSLPHPSVGLWLGAHHSRPLREYRPSCSSLFWCQKGAQMTLRPGRPQEIYLSVSRADQSAYVDLEGNAGGSLGDSILQSAGRLWGGQAMCCGGRIGISLVCPSMEITFAIVLKSRVLRFLPPLPREIE